MLNLKLNYQFTKREKNLIIIALLFLANALIWFLFFQPRLIYMGEIEKEIAEYEVKIEEYTDLLWQEHEKGDHLLDWSKEEERLSVLIPSLSKRREVFKTFEELIFGSPVRINTLNFNAVETGGSAYVIDISLAGSGEYENVLLFLQSLENFPHLLIVDNYIFNLSEGEVSFDCNVQLYFSR